MKIRTLIAGGVAAVAAVIGGNEVQFQMERSAAVNEFKQPVGIEVQRRKIGEEIKSLRTETSETFKGQIDSTGQQTYAAKLYSAQRFWKDADVDTLRPLDLTVREISTLAKLNPFRTHDKFVDAGPYVSSWMDDKPADYRLESNEIYVKFTSITEPVGISARIEPTEKGMKETLTLADEHSPDILQWRVETDGTLIDNHNGGFSIQDANGIIQMQISPPTATDADGKPVTIEAYLVRLDSDILTYQLRLSGDEKFPIEIDPTTQIVAKYTAETGTGYVDAVNATYTTARNATTGTDASADCTIGQDTGYIIYRSFVRIPTLPEMSSVSACTLYCNGSLDQSVTDFNVQIYSSYHGNAVTTADFASFNGRQTGAFDGPTLAAPWSTTSYSADWNTFIFNVSGRDTVLSRTGLDLYLALISSNDSSATAPSGDEYIDFDGSTNGGIYLSVTYLGFYTTVPTSFTLSGAATTSMNAAWTNHHTTGIDSLRIFTGANAWFKTLAETDESTSLTALTPGSQYIFKARVDSGGISGYSNADTLYTLADAPTDFALAGDDSTTFTPSLTDGDNPATVTYAIRDSTLQKWAGADGVADETTAAWRTYAQWQAVKINLVTNNVKHLVGVVAKNGDGIETAYDWIYATTGNYYWRTITGVYKNYYAEDDTFLVARNETTTATGSTNYIFGQAKPVEYSVNRIGMEFIIPELTDVVIDSLLLTADLDESDTEFNFVLVSGFWHVALGAGVTPFYTFNGWGTGTHTGVNLVGTFSSTSYATSMAVPMNAASKDSLVVASQDTARYVLYTSNDFSATDTGVNDSYIRLSAAPELKIQYELMDYVPSSVVVSSIAGATDSVLVTWVDNSATETGFALANAYTGLRLGGNDSTAANIETKRMGGLSINTLYALKIMVLGGKIANELSTSADSTYTLAAVPGAPTITFPTTAIMKIVLNMNSNPSGTKVAIQDSISTKYIHLLAGGVLDTLRTAADWNTYAAWGGAAGCSLSVTPGKEYRIRVKARSGIN
jgi:hypothetical protein